MIMNHESSLESRMNKCKIFKDRNLTFSEMIHYRYLEIENT